MTKSSATIQKTKTGWKLLIVNFQNNVKLTTALEREKLIDLIDIACVLKIHVDNQYELPINQYLMQAT